LAQFDALQARMLPQRSGLPIVNIQATAVAVGQVIPLDRDALHGRPASAPATDDLNRGWSSSSVNEGVIFTVWRVPAGWLLYSAAGRTLLAGRGHPGDDSRVSRR
jgi:hypothetical protein